MTTKRLLDGARLAGMNVASCLEGLPPSLHRPMTLYRLNDHDCSAHPPCEGCMFGLCSLHDTPTRTVCLDCYGRMTTRPDCPFQHEETA